MSHDINKIVADQQVFCFTDFPLFEICLNIKLKLPRKKNSKTYENHKITVMHKSWESINYIKTRALS